MSIRQTIETAFESVGYPGDRDIINCGCAVCKRIIEHFRGTTWREHTLDSLQKHQLAVSLFTPDAFQYYLPAYMLQSLDAWLDTCLIPFLLTKQFLPPHPEESKTKKNQYAKRCAIFNAQQRQAVILYLREYAASGTSLAPEDVTRAIAQLEKPPELLSPEIARAEVRPH